MGSTPNRQLLLNRFVNSFEAEINLVTSLTESVMLNNGKSKMGAVFKSSNVLSNVKLKYSSLAIAVFAG